MSLENFSSIFDTQDGIIRAGKAIIYSMRYALAEYEAVHGNAPPVIFMETDAIRVMKHYPCFTVSYEKGIECRMYGILVKQICGGGFGIYLSDGPISMRDPDEGYRKVFSYDVFKGEDK